jgi:TRAP-type C4-dicarboxylate transport system permease small subunit
VATRWLPAAPDAPAPVRWLGELVDWSVVLIGASLVLLVFANVVLRVFALDPAWVLELGEFLMVWATFLGGAAAARRNGHMTITEFIDKLEGARRLIADGAVQTVVCAVLMILVWYGIGLVNSSWGNVLTTLDWPMALQYLPLPAGAGATRVFVLWDLVQIARGVPREVRYRS